MAGVIRIEGDSRLLPKILAARALAEAIPRHKRTEDTSDKGAGECCHPKGQKMSFSAKEKLRDTATHDTAGSAAECASQ